VRNSKPNLFIVLSLPYFIDLKMTEQMEAVIECLNRIAEALEIIAGTPCDDCECIHPDEVYQYICENPPEREI